MSHLISNGVLPYRYGVGSAFKRPLRSPIEIVLRPDDMAYFSYAGTWTTSSSINLPNSGFVQQATFNNCIQVGRNLTDAYVNGTGVVPNYRWRQVTTDHKPETCWYQGAFGTSARSIPNSYNSVEAYYQIGAYHFTLPDDIFRYWTNIGFTYTLGGVIKAWQSAGLRSSQNTLADPISNAWNFDFTVSSDLASPRVLESRPATVVDLLAESRGMQYTGVRDLWGFSGTTRDGAIPTVLNPPTRTVWMYEAASHYLSDLSSFWVIPTQPLSFDSREKYGYLPYYVTPDIGWWYCASVWDVNLKLRVD